MQSIEMNRHVRMGISRRNYLWQPWLNIDFKKMTPTQFAYCEERPKTNTTTSLHRKPSSAWRRERRRDPIQSEALDMSAATRVHHHTRPSVIVPTAPQPGTTSEDTAVTPTPSATPSTAIGGQRTGIRNPGGVSDPAIDEHFKRSLGLEEYAAVFNASSNADKESGLSVDDHFAKALGDTWKKLQANGSKEST